MECPKIIKTARVSPVLKSFLIGAGIGSVGVGGVAARSGYQIHKRKDSQLTFKQYLKKDKKRISQAIRGGALFGGLTGVWATKVYKVNKPIPKSSISIEESSRLLGLNSIHNLKYKSQVLRAFRGALMMHHANKPGKIKMLKDIEKGIAWEPDKVVNALKAIQKTDWYSKLAFSR